MNTEVMFSSESDEWSTPISFYEKVDDQYHFVFDLACSKQNCKTNDGFTIEDNSLDQNWAQITHDTKGGWLWLNPPYSKCREFVDKAFDEMHQGAKIIMLLPSRTDTKWFHSFIYKKEGVKIEFIKGRLKFSESKNSAPFPSMLIQFNLNDQFFK